MTDVPLSRGDHPKYINNVAAVVSQKGWSHGSFLQLITCITPVNSGLKFRLVEQCGL